MLGSRLARGCGLTAATLVGAFLAPPSTHAQQPQSLESILRRLEGNMRRYLAEVPSFSCDEHLVSKMSSDHVPANLPSGNSPYKETIADSIFRVRRAPAADLTSVLVESREIKTVNGKPASGDKIAGPTTLVGAFSGGLALVSASQQACMRYTLRPNKSGRAEDPYIIQFVTVPVAELSVFCLLRDQGAGRVSINPVNMQLTRIELHVPHHLIVPPRSVGPRTFAQQEVGAWDLSIDYAPILLAGETQWMPVTINSSMVDGDDGTVWSFTARYTNFRKFEVTTRILPAADGPTP